MIEQPGSSLALEREQEIPFSLESGQYLLEVYAMWPELGSVHYGFYLDIQERGEDQTYTDPAGQYRVRLPAEWQPGEVEGTFSGADGAFRTGYLPAMAYMDRAYRVCERLANTPQGPVRKAILSPIQDLDACVLVPSPEMTGEPLRLVAANPAGDPGQRYFYLEADQGHFDAIASSLQLLNPNPEREAFFSSDSLMRPEDVAFWEEAGSQPEVLAVEEYAVMEASIDSRTPFEFNDRLPDEVLKKRAASWDGYQERKLIHRNALLEPFGYSLIARDGWTMDLYELYRGDRLLLDNISEVWPVSVNTAGSDFAVVVGILNDGYRLVRKDSLEPWDMGASWYTPPVFSGDKLLTTAWDGERSLAKVKDGDNILFSFASVFLTSSPVKGFWSWQGGWRLEVDGFLIEDGKNLNEQLGFEEIFGWQILNGKPFYYFRKGPRVGISYDGQVLPVRYDEVIHYRCCGPAGFNNGGDEDMAWFYGLREGMWYYVEVGTWGEE